MDPNQNIYDTFSKIFSCLGLFEAVVALILNPMVIFIILRSKQLRQISTFKILAVSAVNDMLVGIAWNIDTFGYTMLNYTPSFVIPFFCEWFVNFLAYATLCIETWMLLSISVDRLLSMTVKKWTKFYFKGYRPFIYAVLLCLFIAGLNFHLGFTSGYIFYDNETQTEVFYCYMTDPSYGYDWYNFGIKFVLYFGYIAPAAILIIVNFLIIYKATQYSRSQKAMGNTNSVNADSEKKKAQMTKMILFLTFFYITLLLPIQLYSAYLSAYVLQFPFGIMISNISIFAQYFYPSFHIFILYFSNKQFAKETKIILLRIKSNRVTSSFRAANNNASNIQIKSLHSKSKSNAKPTLSRANIQENALYNDNKL